MKYLKLIGIIAFIYIISSLDFGLVVKSILSLNISYLLIYAITFFIFFLIKAYRWHIIQNYFSKPLSFGDNLWIVIETLYLSYATPAKVGDIVRVWIIKKKFNISKKESMIAYVFDRVQDLAFLIIFTIFGLLFVIDIEVSDYVYVGLVAFLILYIAKNKILNLFRSRLSFVKKVATDYRFELKIFIINCSAFFFYFLQVYFLTKAMGLSISYLFVVALVSISAIATLLPISVAGLGVREGIFIYLLGTIGISKENAVLLSLLDNVVFIAIFIVLLHLFSKFYLKARLGVS